MEEEEAAGLEADDAYIAKFVASQVMVLSNVIIDSTKAIKELLSNNNNLL